jgi:hypothetical protein
MGVGGQLHAPAALPPGKRPGIHCIGGLVGLGYYSSNYFTAALLVTTVLLYY